MVKFPQVLLYPMESAKEKYWLDLLIAFIVLTNGMYAGIFRYSEDDILLAPSISALQGMLQIAESYANSHGLKFSTDPDPRKSKTKCISWMISPRPLQNMKLCGNSLPWVNALYQQKSDGWGIH